jgi:ADP-heptose:LPS heptosyltransferase
MIVALYVSKRVFRAWPDEYVKELVGKLIARGDRVFIVEDDAPENEDVITNCDLFVGVPGEYAELAKAKGKRVIHLLGPTLRGEGVVSPIICAGCLDKMEGKQDCFFGDEICMYEITPNDVLGAM